MNITNKQWLALTFEEKQAALKKKAGVNRMRFNFRKWLSLPIEKRLVKISNAINKSGGFKR